MIDIRKTLSKLENDSVENKEDTISNNDSLNEDIEINSYDENSIINAAIKNINMEDLIDIPNGDLSVLLED